LNKGVREGQMLLSYGGTEIWNCNKSKERKYRNEILEDATQGKTK
jgi:hypothetical protein